MLIDRGDETQSADDFTAMPAEICVGGTKNLLRGVQRL